MNNSTLFSHSENNHYFLGYKNLINLDLTEVEYYSALKEACYGNISKEGRIIIHEYAHWLQSVGTPYGFFLELIRHYENELLKQLEELITDRLYKENQIKISPPFKKYIEDKLFYTIQDEVLWDLFDQWLDLYFLTIVTDERRDSYYEKIKKYQNFFSSYSECKHTQDIENYLFLPLLFSRADRFLDCRLSEFIGRKIPPVHMNPEDLYSERNLKAATASGLNGMSLQITHHSLWESYATVVEYMDVPEEFVFPSQFDTAGRHRAWNEYYDPLRYLELYLVSSKFDKQLFLKSCICIFDIVFSPPILPQCVLLREDKISMLDFDIVSRFYAVAEAAKYVGNISDYPSIGEYSTAICRALNWCTPDEVFLQLRRCWDSLNVIPAGKMFQYFITMRMTGEYLPLNRMRFLCEIRESNANPCFLKLKDTMITNTTLSYGLLMDTQIELIRISTMLQMDVLSPEPMEYDYKYYQEQLLRELVEKLWEQDDKVITLTVPEACACLDQIESFLHSWIDNNHIDVQLNLKGTIK